MYVCSYIVVSLVESSIRYHTQIVLRPQVHEVTDMLALTMIDDCENSDGASTTTNGHHHHPLLVDYDKMPSKFSRKRRYFLIKTMCVIISCQSQLGRVDAWSGSVRPQIGIAGLKRRSPDSSVLLGTFVSKRSHPNNILRLDAEKDNKQSFGENKDVARASNLLPTVMLGLFALLDPFPAYAASSSAAAAAEAVSVFNRQYQDPQHPLCQRRIEVSHDGISFHFEGTAVGSDDSFMSEGRGCSPEDIKKFGGIRRVSLDGSIIVDDDRKGNPRLVLTDKNDVNLQGVWEPADNDSSNDADGIRWSNGNKWLVKNKPLSTAIGEWIFLAYIGFSGLAGVKGVADKINERKQGQ